MPLARTAILTILAMLAFAGNSLLCRMALKQTDLDAASFTSIRLISGALVLWLIVRLRGESIAKAGNWLAALALVTYAACFAIAYISLPAGTGALLLWKRKYLLLTLFLLRMTKITENRQHKTRHFRLLILNKKSDI
jgi:hypothetical protein